MRAKEITENISPTFLSQEQLASRWLCSKMKIRRMMRAGKLLYLANGRHVLFAVSDIEEYERNCRVSMGATA